MRALTSENDLSEVVRFTYSTGKSALLARFLSDYRDSKLPTVLESERVRDEYLRLVEAMGPRMAEAMEQAAG